MVLFLCQGPPDTYSRSCKEYSMGKSKGSSTRPPLKLKEAAEYLGISEITFRRHLASGFISGGYRLTPNGPWRFTQAVLDQYLSERVKEARVNSRPAKSALDLFNELVEDGTPTSEAAAKAATLLEITGGV